jgi:hypothetical protein
MNLFDTILNREEFRIQPPVLIDIGASEYIHAAWRRLAPYSICIAFDADERELNVEDKRARQFKRLHVVRALVVAKTVKTVPFHLTASPYCSSTLEPDMEQLDAWAFADKFAVEKMTAMPATTLKRALKEAGVTTIDWFKSDSQGLDLRLFASVPDEIRHGISVAEFEPGFIDAYKGEDKIHDLLLYMESQQFWLADAVIKGPRRISPASLRSIASSSFMRKLIELSIKPSPGWAELTYLRAIKGKPAIRQLLFSWMAASILHQHGWGYEVATRGRTLYADPIFMRMQRSSRAALYRSLLSGRIASAAFEKFAKLLKIA